MIFLKNFDFANLYLNFESKIESNKSLNTKINGWYKIINGVLSGIVVLDNNLYFLYADDKFLITDDYKVILKATNNHFEKEFILLKGDEKLISFIYTLPDSKMRISPFEYIDEEDFKWGDFIRKIIDDSEKKKIFINNLMEMI